MSDSIKELRELIGNLTYTDIGEGRPDTPPVNLPTGNIDMAALDAKYVRKNEFQQLSSRYESFENRV